MHLVGHGLGLILYSTAAHFLLSAFLGSLVYYLTLTTLSHSIYFQDSVGVFSTRHFSFLVAAFLSVFLHTLEDYLFGWF